MAPMFPSARTLAAWSPARDLRLRKASTSTDLRNRAIAETCIPGAASPKRQRPRGHRMRANTADHEAARTDGTGRHPPKEEKIMTATTLFRCTARTGHSTPFSRRREVTLGVVAGASLRRTQR